MEEKRVIPRFKVPIRTDFAKASSKEEMLAGHSVDISFKGMRLFSPNCFDSGEILDIFFHFPDKPYQEAVGKVMWSRPVKGEFEMGISFLNIKDLVKQNILDYITSYFPQEFSRHWWS